GFQPRLVRDAAYESMPKKLRASLNERFAEWLERLGRGQELDELVAYHLEQAYRHRFELGLVDEHTRRLATRAGDLLASAGGRALGRNDVQAALNLLSRAVALEPEHEPALAIG